MRKVAWTFGDGPTFQGFTDDSRWNGFLNIWVTPDVHAEVLKHISSSEYADEREISDFRSNEPKLHPDHPEPLVCYGWGMTTEEVKLSFSEPLKTIDDCKAWIHALQAADKMFHFEDSPETIVEASSGQPTFAPDEVELVKARVQELYGFNWGNFECPIGYALYVSGLDKTTEPKWQAEFPDYPVDTMPAIPATWEDFSWHNDACPSFYADNGLLVFVDYAQVTLREFQTKGPRFTVLAPGHEACQVVAPVVFESDDWEAVLAFVASTSEEKLAALTQEYADWNKANDLSLGSADEHLTDETLSDAQRRWLADFVERWRGIERLRK